MKRTVASLLALAAFAVPTLSLAGRCYRAGATPRAPFDPGMSPREYGLSYGDFGTTPTPCSFGSFGLGIVGSALLADSHSDPNLYGVLAGGVQMRLSIPFGDRFFVTGSLGLPQYIEVHNATVIANTLTAGPLVLGAHLVIAHGDNWQIAPYVRLMTFVGTQYAIGFGVEPGISSVLTVANRVAFHAGISLPSSSTQLNTASDWYVTLRGSLEVAWRFMTPIEIGLGLDLSGRLTKNTLADPNAPPRPPETLAPFAGFRFFVGSATALQISASALSVGADNTLVRFGLSLWSSW